MRFSSHKLFARAANYHSILASVAPNASPQTPRHASLCATAPPLASRWHAGGRLAAQIPIAERAARPTERTLPRFRALALFGRRSPERVASSSLPASENLQKSCCEQMQQKRLFDRLVGAVEQGIGYGEAEHPCGLGIDDQLELGRLHDRQLGRLRPLQDAAGIDADLTPSIRDVASVAHQPAGFSHKAICICRGDRVARRQIDQLDKSAVEKAVATDEKRIGPLAPKGCEGRID